MELRIEDGKLRHVHTEIKKNMKKLKSVTMKRSYLSRKETLFGVFKNLSAYLLNKIFYFSSLTEKCFILCDYNQLYAYF